MKYKIFTLAIILSVILAGCSNENIIDESQEKEMEAIVYEYYTSLENQDYRDALYHIDSISYEDINYKELALKELAEFMDYSIKLTDLRYAGMYINLGESNPYVTVLIETTYKNETIIGKEFVILKSKESGPGWKIQEIKSRDHYLPLRTVKYFMIP